MNVIDKARKQTEKDVARYEKKEQEKDEQKVVEVSFFENESFILEQINVAPHATRATAFPLRGQKSEGRFLCLNKQTGETKIIETFEDDEITYKPIVNSLTHKGIVYLPTAVEEYTDTYTLLNEIKEYLLTYFDPPEMFADFLPCYVLFTWVYDKFPFIPYLHFLGLTGTGKTTAAETVAAICYKAIDAAGAATIASMFRLADQWRGTMFLDEFELANMGDDSSAMANFLKTGVSDRAVFRIEGEKSREVVPYFVKAPKIFTSEQPLKGAGLQSRTILVQMAKSVRPLPLYKINKYHKTSQQLRNKLLLWRLHHLNKVNLEEIEYGIAELRSFDRRVQQIITPIYYLADEKARVQLLTFAKVQEEQTKRERRDSLEGRVFNSICELYEDGLPVALATVREQLNEENDQQGVKARFSERKLSETIRKILNFKIERVGHNKESVILIEQNFNRYQELKDYFGIDIRGVERVASVASDALPEWEEPPL